MLSFRTRWPVAEWAHNTRYVPDCKKWDPTHTLQLPRSSVTNSTVADPGIPLAQASGNACPLRSSSSEQQPPWDVSQGFGGWLGAWSGAEPSVASSVREPLEGWRASRKTYREWLKRGVLTYWRYIRREARTARALAGGFLVVRRLDCRPEEVPAEALRTSGAQSFGGTVPGGCRQSPQPDRDIGYLRR